MSDLSAIDSLIVSWEVMRLEKVFLRAARTGTLQVPKTENGKKGVFKWRHGFQLDRLLASSPRVHAHFT
jgi:hypothetical protein